MANLHHDCNIMRQDGLRRRHGPFTVWFLNVLLCGVPPAYPWPPAQELDTANRSVTGGRVLGLAPAWRLLERGADAHEFARQGLRLKAELHLPAGETSGLMRQAPDGVVRGAGERHSDAPPV
jgi:hypothetical protein